MIDLQQLGASMEHPSIDMIRAIIAGEVTSLPTPAELAQMINAWQRYSKESTQKDDVAAQLRLKIPDLEQAWQVGFIAGNTAHAEETVSSAEMMQQCVKDASAYSSHFSLRQWYKAGWRAGWEDTF